MATLQYRVTISHEDKGLGHLARRALRDHSKQEYSPVVSATFLGKPTGSKTVIEIAVSDASIHRDLPRIIKNGIPQRSKFEIEEITLVGDREHLQRLEALEQEVNDMRAKLQSAQGDNALLEAMVGDAEKRASVSSPVEGILSYFSTLTCGGQAVVGADEDRDFIRYVLHEGGENTFLSYVKLRVQQPLGINEISRVLSFNIAGAEKELARLQERYKEQVEEARRSRTYHVSVGNSGELRRGITTITDPAVGKYRRKEDELQRMRRLQPYLETIKIRYDRITAALAILAQESGPLPVLFSRLEGPFRVYFPFLAKKSDVGFVQDLLAELKENFPSGHIEQEEHHFLTYRVYEAEDVGQGIERVIASPPFTLRLAGYNRIIPCLLG